MPRSRPPTSGYARIAQEEEQTGQGFLDDNSEDEDPYERPVTLSSSAPHYAPIQPSSHRPMRPSRHDSQAEPRPSPGRRRHRSNSGVDIKAINARLERWAEEIASKFKIGRVKGKTDKEEQLEIHHSVFQPPEGVRPLTADAVLEAGVDGEDSHHFTRRDFEETVESVRVAIEMGVHPSMISQGSSGSYFARNSDGIIVGVFKPKDEEPYASRNPKWTKWIHRNLFPCFFGRACLIPNLSYVSEAAAYVLDNRLRTNLVPYTDIVYLSSKSFYYDYWDRRNFYRKRKSLPPKVGSFQVFLKGFKDANVFLREHPWPDPYNPSFRTGAAPKKKPRPWSESCRPRGTPSDDEDDAEYDDVASPQETQQRRFFWTEALQRSFREELEKLVILDYIMRNTDRGLDNWMIKVDWENQRVSLAAEAPKPNGRAPSSPPPRPMGQNGTGIDMSHLPQPSPYKLQQPMDASSKSTTTDPTAKGPSIAIGAIDNSLSWPWKHPDAWRSFPFGWLFLPVSLIGQPFSQKSRDHFLPLLTSTAWWSEIQVALRRTFSQDSDFKERMFARQIAVMKGQAWNVVETLKTPDHGPLELTRRARVCVWDDLVDIPVAVPLRMSSDEMRRRRDADLRGGIQEEEMDISAANGSTPNAKHDLLGLGRAVDMPRAEPFSDASHHAPDEQSEPEDGREPGSLLPRPVDTTAEVSQNPNVSHTRADDDMTQGRNGSRRPKTTRSRTRASLDERRRPGSSSRRRVNSLSFDYGNRGFVYDGDDLEGDLGYAAAEDLEKNQRKVIVERLETVKSKYPVFTWC